MADININDINELNLDDLENISGGKFTAPQFEAWSSIQADIVNELVAQYKSGIEDWRTAVDNVFNNLNIDPAFVSVVQAIAQEVFQKYRGGYIK